MLTVEKEEYSTAENVVNVECDERIVVDLRIKRAGVHEVHALFVVGVDELEARVPELRERHLDEVHRDHRVVPLPVEVVPLERQLVEERDRARAVERVEVHHRERVVHRQIARRAALHADISDELLIRSIEQECSEYKTKSTGVKYSKSIVLYVRAYRLHWELRYVVRVLEEAAVQTRLVGLVRRRVRAAAHERGAVQHRQPVRVRAVSRRDLPANARPR